METLFGGGALVAHPDAPARNVPNVACSYVWRGAGEWSFDFMVGAPSGALRLPEPVAPARADGLWRRSCFELFLRPADGAFYFEFNFSPSGEWAAYRFDGYRAGMTALDVAPPRVISTVAAQFDLSMHAHLTGLGMDAETVRSLLDADAGAERGPPSRYGLSAYLDDPRLPPGGDWLAGLSAVIEEADGTLSYWALAHPAGKPDFHHPDCFVLELPAPDAR